MTKKKQAMRKALTYGARAKRRSVSQRVGIKGESIFATWAADHNVVANPCPHDFGIDYFCQVLQPAGRGVEELRGDTLAVQIRSVNGGDRPRIVIDKSDAETALRLETPYLLVGIHVEKKRIYFRFLDIKFAQLLAAFIAAPQNALTLRIDGDEFQSTRFREQLEINSNPGVQYRLRLRCAELCMEREMKGARLRVAHDSHSGLALVQVPSISSIFRVKSGHADVLMRYIFERGELPPLTKAISLQPSLLKTAEITGADTLLVSGGLESVVDGLIERAGEQQPLRFHVRRAGNTRAYISESGLILTVSDAVKQGSQGFVHRLGVRLGTEFGRTLDTFTEFDAALRLIGPGATIRFEKDSHAFDVSAWGPPLLEFGTAYEQIIEAFTFASLPLNMARLADLLNEEFTASLAVLSGLAKGATAPSMLPRFLLGPAADDTNFEEKMRRCGFNVPIVMNVKSRGVVVWLTGEGKAYIDNSGAVCGLFAENQHDYKVEIREQRIAKESKTPEIWVAKEWPAIPLLQKLKQKAKWQGGIRHALGGRIWPIAAEA